MTSVRPCSKVTLAARNLTNELRVGFATLQTGTNAVIRSVEPPLKGSGQQTRGNHVPSGFLHQRSPHQTGESTSTQAFESPAVGSCASNGLRLPQIGTLSVGVRHVLVSFLPWLSRQRCIQSFFGRCRCLSRGWMSFECAYQRFEGNLCWCVHDQLFQANQMGFEGDCDKAVWACESLFFVFMLHRPQHPSSEKWRNEELIDASTTMTRRTHGFCLSQMT